MKNVLVRAGSSLLAAAIGYICLTVFVENLGVPLKVVVAVALGVCAFGVAVWAAGGDEKDAPGSTHVASNLKGASAYIEDVRAQSTPDQEIKVASTIHTQGPINIKRVSIDSAKDKQ